MAGGENDEAVRRQLFTSTPYVVRSDLVSRRDVGTGSFRRSPSWRRAFRQPEAPRVPGGVLTRALGVEMDPVEVDPI